MKVVLQRVKSASVSVDGELIASIGKGILALAAVGKDDTVKDSEKSAAKLLAMKLWDDENGGRWKKNVKDIGGEILCVSQFTLYASTKKGSKPDFHKSASAEKGRELYGAFFNEVQKQYEKDKVKDGVFQAMMDVASVNDGPVSETSADPVGVKVSVSGVSGLEEGEQPLYGKKRPSSNETPPIGEIQPMGDEAPPLPQTETDATSEGPTKYPPMGINYICDHEDVTLEIDTDPGAIDVPKDMQSMKVQGKMSVEELADLVQEMAYDFELSPELME